MMKAYKVTAYGIDSSPGIYQAENAGKARYLCYLACKEIGYHICFREIHVVRAPEYDNYNLPPKTGIALEYIHIYKPKEGGNG
jgi:hypothetical protein